MLLLISINFTPKTSHSCLKNGTLCFPGTWISAFLLPHTSMAMSCHKSFVGHIHESLFRSFFCKGKRCKQNPPLKLAYLIPPSKEGKALTKGPSFLTNSYLAILLATLSDLQSGMKRSRLDCWNHLGHIFQPSIFRSKTRNFLKISGIRDVILTWVTPPPYRPFPKPKKPTGEKAT